MSIEVFVERSTLREYSGRFAVDAVIAPVRVDNVVSGWFEESDLQIQEIAGPEYHKRILRRFFDGEFDLSKPVCVREVGKFNVIFVPFDAESIRSKILYDGLYYAFSESLEKLVVPITPNWLIPSNPLESERIIQMGVETVSDFIDWGLKLCLLCCSDDIGMAQLEDKLRSRWKIRLL